MTYGYGDGSGFLAALLVVYAAVFGF
ncbi:MAG: hypothetical protein QOD50_2325, partial [Actinomycetota bacterium]|nr:hypothetical protein [Actinomycetota bacterium]